MSSAVILARGFWNNIRMAKKEGFVLEPIIVVHDSNTNYFPVDKLWDIKGFYDKNFTEFCRDACGVPFLFDLLIGSNYEDAVGFNQLDDITISMSGNGKSILQILDKLDNESNIKYKILSVKDKNSKIDLNPIKESIVMNTIDNPIERFIRENGTNIFMDLSKYEVVLEKLS
jgi:hypothetical protein